ncbi:LuxR family transcriptional regulator [Paracoccus aurantiacus]|uniref:LuxR family transcriptional regulator n=1 Tax=Paracoccus aurantiacus TaxID=2599412 RepID=A0A5C6RRK4_9RHOB|nr:LuxR family transcriptional regulator [Paracoccus aurantiacus]TXB65046.1 LuxR family transcriptional regulator [Paracoccus aurantiacus]
MLEQLIPNFREVQDYLYSVGSTGWILGLNVDFINAEHLLNRFPESWNKIYVEHNYIFRDPIVAWASSREGALRWSEVPIDDIGGLFEAARAYGLTYGGVLAKKVNGRRSFLTVARNDRELTDAELATLNVKFSSWLDILYNFATLTPGELDVLKAQRDGMSYKEAARALGISPATVKVRLERSKTKLDAASATNAVAIAMARHYFD